MKTTALPSEPEMIDAFLSRNATYEGIFVTAVKTTGIFCRPTCPAKKPRPENVRFFPTSKDALQAGFRPCRRCKPLEQAGKTPPWLGALLREMEEDPSRRWRDEDLRERGISPTRVRRWFQENHDMTFHAYSRALRLGAALGQIQHGGSVIDAAFETGYDSLSGFNDAFRKLLGHAPTVAKDAPVVRITRIPTDLGPMVAGVLGEDLVLLEFIDRRMLPRQLQILQRRLRCVYVPGQDPAHDEVAAQLDEYFRGQRISLELPFRAPGTPFQEKVWTALRTLGPGETCSYRELAMKIGQPTAVRAVARANGDNRLAILIPCHRVIGSDGELTGYGGGLWRKKRLLELESSGRDGVKPGRSLTARAGSRVRSTPHPDRPASPS